MTKLETTTARFVVYKAGEDYFYILEFDDDVRKLPTARLFSVEIIYQTSDNMNNVREQLAEKARTEGLKIGINHVPGLY